MKNISEFSSKELREELARRAQEEEEKAISDGQAYVGKYYIDENGDYLKIVAGPQRHWNNSFHSYFSANMFSVIRLECPDNFDPNICSYEVDEYISPSTLTEITKKEFFQQLDFCYKELKRILEKENNNGD